MKSLEAYEQEIRYQLEDLPELAKALSNRLDEEEQRRCIFTGAGDSYAAALAAVYASNYRIRFIDPLEITERSVYNSLLYIVSISGITKANINAAEVSRNAARRIAITADPESKLAKICDDTITLKFRRTGILTAGSISFTASMLACISVAKEVSIERDDVRELFMEAEQNSADVRLEGEIYLLGNGISYPLTIYASAKLYEIMGIKSSPWMLEQFCHMGIFSMKDTDTVLILSDNEKAKELYSRLECNKFLFDLRGKSIEEQMLYGSFLIQLISLRNAKLNECYFVKNEKIRRLSSEMIY